jgi:hypothetical protein
MSLTLDDKATKLKMLRQMQESIQLKQEQREIEVSLAIYIETIKIGERKGRSSEITINGGRGEKKKNA